MPFVCFMVILNETFSCFITSKRIGKDKKLLKNVSVIPLTPPLYAIDANIGNTPYEKAEIYKKSLPFDISSLPYSEKQAQYSVYLLFRRLYIFISKSAE